VCHEPSALNLGELARLRNQGKRETAKSRNCQARVKPPLPGQECWREERREFASI